MNYPYIKDVINSLYKDALHKSICCSGCLEKVLLNVAGHVDYPLPSNLRKRVRRLCKYHESLKEYERLIASGKKARRTIEMNHI
jgi:transposase